MATTTVQTDRTLTFTREFNAPPQLVFDAFTQPQHLSRWWMPAGCEMLGQQLELKLGGEWHYTVKTPAADIHRAKAVYREIDRPRRLVFDDMFVSDKGEVINNMPQKHVTITFEPTSSGTKLTVHVVMSTPAQLTKLVSMQFVPGFTQALSQLEALLNEVQ